MSPATIADIGEIHVDTYATNSGLSRRGTSGLEKRTFATKVNKIRCGINGGGLANYDKGRERFQKFAGTIAEGAGSVALYRIKVGLQDALCNNGLEGTTCDMYVNALVSVPGLLITDEFEHYFDRAFDEVRQECRENGGSAELLAADYPAASDVCGVPTCTADGKMGLKVADFGAEFYIHDAGATCPANPPPSDVCEISSFN
jgi:hypothetical protein